MALNLNTFITEVHDNAVEHGWWEDERSFGEIVSLFHSELSEALEEYRAKRPMLWFPCTENGGHAPCDPKDAWDCLNFENKETCEYRGSKPEGIAIELLDCVIRIFDWFGYIKLSTMEGIDVDHLIMTIPEYVRAEIATASFPEVVASLHSLITHAYDDRDDPNKSCNSLLVCAAVIFYWLIINGVDAEKLIVLKHEYNKTRPYRHGNKAC